ncbi:GMC family oxidoreductase [Pseudomonas sp. NFX98]|uniref:GMC family oxidoreductase n=1 Tax=Pseudomonas sp. NFX98 TaxID=3399122 RepID=UPI0039FCC128
MNNTYDYVIVGSGSAGCVLAFRLTEDPSVKVLLLEAGGSSDAFFIKMPSGYGKIIGDPRYDWCYNSGPEPHIHKRELFTPRGKVIGGSSSINGMAYVRGHRNDFDQWHRSGNTGWSWDQVLPLFGKIENYHGEFTNNRSTTGRMHVSVIDPHPLSARIIEAAEQAGLPAGGDYNCGDPNGLGLMQMNKWHGKRFSSEAAYLKPAMERPNLTLISGAEVSRVVLEGRVAVGVEYLHQGLKATARAREEVILAAGAINSPKLLQLSGIGAPDRLAAAGVPVVHALPGVGENLQDHYNIGIQLPLKNVGSINEQMRGFRLIFNGIRYLFTGGGILGNSPAQVTGYSRVMEDADSADIQLWGMPGSVRVVRGGKGENKLVMDSTPGVSLSFTQNRPASRGHVHIKTSDPQAKPEIVNNYLSEQLDQRVAVRGLRLIRKILEQPAFDGIRAGTAGPDEAFAHDDALLDYARKNGRSSYHLAGTCRMGHSVDAVVDHELRVHGLDRLRVIDSSIMPTIVSANTHAATMMIAEKGAELLLKTRRETRSV